MLKRVGKADVRPGSAGLIGLVFPGLPRPWSVATATQELALGERRKAEMETLIHLSDIEPTLLTEVGDRQYWLFQGDLWWDNEQYTQQEVRVLILERAIRREKRIQRAASVVELGELPSTAGREPIPDAVKIHVWQRDGGSCQRCGRTENLEFDHIIPLALGGGNSPRNLQLLCGDCNRSKGGHLI